MKAGWAQKTLGSLASINYGFTAKAASEPVGPRFLRITDIQDDSVDWDKVPFCEISDSELAKYDLICGDIVFARTGATTGKSFLVTEPPNAVFASYLIRLRLVGHDVLPKFVSYFFQSPSYWNFVSEGVVGSTQGGFNASKLSAMTIPVPNIAEQQRIVSILDKAFEGIATAKANAEKNLQNAKQLFESYVQSIFDNRGTGWSEEPLSKLSKINYGYTESSSLMEVGPKFLRITDIQDNHVDWTKVPYCQIEQVDVEKYRLVDGDILFARTGATTGKSYLVTQPPHAVFASYLIRAQLQSDKILPEFVNLFFQSSSYWEEVRRGMTGSTLGGFNASKLSALVIPFPEHLDQQKSIVASSQRFKEACTHLESVYTQKSILSEELKKSILHQAFSGQL